MKITSFIVALGLAMLIGAAAHAEKRVALVIGNGHYASVPVLANPVNDAEDIGAALEGLGFSVEILRDADREATESAIARFAREADGAAIALLYYSGHGIQMNGENYLLPVDFRLGTGSDLDAGAIRLASLMQAMSGAAAKVVILDACRDNPFLAQARGLTDVGPRSAPGLAPIGLGAPSRSIGPGLAQPTNTDLGMLIAFSTSPGSVASDGTGRNSPFTAALLRYLNEPGVDLREIMTYVRRVVVAETGGRQTPWDNSSLLQDVVLSVPRVAVPPNASAASPDIPSARPSSSFDGTWVGRHYCEAWTWKGIPAFERAFFLTVKGGVAVSQGGQQGQPGYFHFKGNIDANGKLFLYNDGISGGGFGSGYPKGTHFQQIFEGQVSGKTLIAKRLYMSRSCKLELHRLSETENNALR